MKKRFIYILTAVVLLSLILSGCGASSSGAMDFNEKLDLKTPDPLPGEYPTILFVGNSHTYVNELPDIFMRIAEAMGHEADVYSLTESAYSLTDYADTEDELGADLDAVLSGMEWDFVILQENTNDAYVNPDNGFLPAAETLNAKIKASGAQTALLMTWSPKDGLNSGNLSLSKEEVQTTLTNNYISVADKLDCLLIPAGVAFMICNEKYPDIELWDEDGSHPSLEGSYLAALTAFSVIYQQSAVGCDENMGIDEDAANKLQEIATEVALG